MTSIIATLGPASANKTMIHALHQAGVKIFRFNFAHDTEDSAMPIINIIRELERESGQKIHTLIDLEGPGIRTATIPSAISYVTGDQFKIYTTTTGGTERDLHCDYKALTEIVPEAIIKIDAGLFQVKVLETAAEYVLVQALNDFKVGSRRHINLPGTHVKLPSFTDKDKRNALFAIQAGCEYVALSFVRSGGDIKEVRNFLDTNGGQHVRIVAKIENEEGITDIQSIAQEADMIMVARGDLGTELPIENIPLYQIEIIRQSRNANKQVIVATEMLESMIHSPTPTRAEVNDIFYAVIEGADYVMLSGETAVGERPLACVQMMQKVIDSAATYI